MKQADILNPTHSRRWLAPEAPAVEEHPRHLVEQHRIDRHDARCAAIDAVTFAGKHLYNAALSLTRQAYILEGTRVIGYAALDKLAQPTHEYRALPATVAQWVV